MGQQTIADVTRAVIADVAPRELRGFDDTVDAWTPRAAARATRAGNEPAANAAALAGEMVSALALTMATGMAQTLVVPPAGLLARWSSGVFRRRPAPTTTAPGLPVEQKAAVRDEGIRIARARGADPALAESLSSAFVDHWPPPR